MFWKIKATHQWPGTCRLKNGTKDCQRAFPNTFNIAAVAFADISGSNGSNTSPAYVEQFEQFTNTTTINHARDHKYAKATSGILIASVVLNFFFIPLRLIVDKSRPRTKLARIFFLFVALDWFMLVGAVVMVYLIIRNEIAGIYFAKPTLQSKNWPVRFEIGFWLLVGAAACRPLFGVLSTPGLFFDQTESPTDKIDPELRSRLVSKLAYTIRVLRNAVGTYQGQAIIDSACISLLQRVGSDESLANFIFDGHFNIHSAPFLLGMSHISTDNPPGLPLWDSCQSRGQKWIDIASKTNKRGVYLIVLRECNHNLDGISNLTQYMYVGSGSGIGGVMKRVGEHTSPDYRRGPGRPQLQIYRAWESLRNPCIAIYLLAEWNPLHRGMSYRNTESYGEILLTEAICQVALQTFCPDANGGIPDFTQFLQQHTNLFSDVWTGCNVNSALQEPRRDHNTRS